MDPDEALRELRAWATKTLNEATPDESGAVGFICETEVRAAEVFNELDKWLSRGGFTPAVWGDRPLIISREGRPVAAGPGIPD